MRVCWGWQPRMTLLHVHVLLQTHASICGLLNGGYVCCTLVSFDIRMCLMMVMPWPSTVPSPSNHSPSLPVPNHMLELCSAAVALQARSHGGNNYAGLQPSFARHTNCQETALSSISQRQLEQLEQLSHEDARSYLEVHAPGGTQISSHNTQSSKALCAYCQYFSLCKGK